MEEAVFGLCPLSSQQKQLEKSHYLGRALHLLSQDDGGARDGQGPRCAVSISASLYSAEFRVFLQNLSVSVSGNCCAVFCGLLGAHHNANCCCVLHCSGVHAATASSRGRLGRRHAKTPQCYAILS